MPEGSRAIVTNTTPLIARHLARRDGGSFRFGGGWRLSRSECLQPASAVISYPQW
jgi:hypothetical protein